MFFRGQRTRNMPRLVQLPSCVIRMYFEDHNPPHVHVVGPDFEAKMTIADARLLKGALPAQVEREAANWIAANRDYLKLKWEEFK
tara:strand:- start:611 stop:865 length:255 start_codon:yes stop_codon:yes gene_type:complete